MTGHLTPFLEARDTRRRVSNLVACGTLTFLSGVAIGALFLVFGYVLYRGFPAINWAFFIETPRPVGEVGGGLANAMVGSLIILLLASLLGIPWGILTGVYLSEYGRGRLGSAVRFCSDMLSSVPSIVIGLFAYALLVVPMKHFSALAGSVALAVMMVPTIARSTEELLRLVPNHIREAGLALGVPRWKVILLIVLRGNLSAILTGVMLAIARASGETAPLLFTALNSRFLSWRVDQPIASLPVQIYTYAIAPFDDWHRQAWGGALVLVVFVFSLNLLARSVIRPKMTRD
ncbi:MAG: phosphate ABC transporter permease PstA [Deltaproteobacteria bacterium]|nr:phosphate ABC transporter permease PstA [Deltaproteobacteria bacterium]